MSILSMCEWLQALPWASGIRESAWKFPLVESVHSLAISVLVWPTAILDLRLLGLVMRRRPVSEVAGQFLPWTWAGFAMMAPTGALLFASEAVKAYHSPFFRIKLVLLVLAGLNALVFHQTIYRSAGDWDRERVTPPRARLAGGLSLAFWIGVIAMGRALAYV